MKYLIEQCIFPIMDGNLCIGQGFVADGYFITAAHVVKDNPDCYITVEDKIIKLIQQDYILQGERDIWNDEMQHDVILFKFTDIPSILHLTARRVTFEDILQSYCITVKYDKDKNKYYNELSVEEVTLVNQSTSNYLWCKANRFVGSSGSPLLIDNEVVGIMHSGNNNGICTFLKVRSFVFPPSKRNNPISYKEEPMTPEYFNKRAQEQINDAFE